MNRTKVSFDDVKVGDTLYIESTGAEYAKCNQRTCKVVGFYREREAICVDLGEGFLGHNASGYVTGDTGYNLWEYNQQYYTMFKVEEEKEEVPETKNIYSGKVLRHLKVGDVFLILKLPNIPNLEGYFFQVHEKYRDDYGFTMKRVDIDDGRTYIVSHSMDILSKALVIQTTYPLSKPKQDKINKLEAKLERITNKLKTLKESGE